MQPTACPELVEGAQAVGAQRKMSKPRMDEREATTQTPVATAESCPGTTGINMLRHTRGSHPTCDPNDYEKSRHHSQKRTLDST
jgi:hypothetical protein